MTNQEEVQTVTETPRRRGRKPTFPDVQTAPLMTKIPVDTLEQLREIAAIREEPINLILDRLIQRGFKDATRSRSKKAS